jgi:hypothetical protein
MTTAKEMQNLAREESVFMAFFKTSSCQDCAANESMIRAYLESEYLPVTAESVEVAAEELSESLVMKPKPPAPRPAAAAPKEDPEPVRVVHFLREGDMTPSQLARVRSGHAGALPPLPDTITRQTIREASGKQLAEWIRTFGDSAITARYNNLEENE